MTQLLFNVVPITSQLCMTHVSLAYKRVHQLGFSRQRLSKIIVNHKAFQLEGHGEKKEVAGQSQAYIPNVQSCTS